MSNADEPLQKTNQPPSQSPTLFSELPMDIVCTILAHVPKRYYPILACVSKNFRSIVRSPEIHKIRSFFGKDSLYICFMDQNSLTKTRHWFNLRRVENNPTENLLVSVDLAFPYQYDSDPSIVPVGPEIFFICGSCVPSSNLFIFDTRTGKLRRGPNLLTKRVFKSAGLVGGKIYVIGGYGDYGRDYKNEAESFDLKMQTWEPAPLPKAKEIYIWSSAATVSLDKKVYALRLQMITSLCYDTEDGSCQIFEMPCDNWWRTGVCVIDNVLYVYYARFGLMWYDSKLMLWRVVNGLNHLDRVKSVAMAEYYGKLAFLWEEEFDCCSKEKKIWCRMIALDKTQVGINGTVEPCRLLRIVPIYYSLQHCLSVSD